MNYYRRYIGDFQADTMALSMLEQGAYDRLLDFYYATEKPIPLNTDRAAIICRAVTLEDRAAVQAVLDTYFERRSDGWHNARADKEIEMAKGRIGGATDAGKSGGLAKWGSARASALTRAERLKAAREKGTHTEEEWLAMVEICDGKCLRCSEPSVLVKDHIKPIYQGGSDSIDNIQPLCRSCNSSKGPDSTDLRPSNWSDLLSSVMPSKGSSNTPHPPTTNHQLKTKPLSSASADYSGEFLRFWKFWPSTQRKQGKFKSYKLWRSMKLEPLADEIVAHVEAMKASKQWRDGFDPMPETYLRNRRWEDGTAGAAQSGRDEFAGAI